MSGFPGNVYGPVQAVGGTQYYAGRDQYIAGRDLHIAGRDQVAYGQGAAHVLAEVASLRGELDGLRLTAVERSQAEQDLVAVEGALRGRKPDRTTIGEHMRSFAAGLKEAGALAAAGASVITSIQVIAQWLGPLGSTVLASLGR